MTTPAPTPDNLPPDDMDAWYTRCPRCGLIGPAGSADYALTGPPPTGQIDWTKPIRVNCVPCGHYHDIGLADLLDRDATHTCSRCMQDTPVPAGAAQVVCLGCHLFAQGPAARTDRQVADELRATETLHGLELREAVRQAKRRADRDPDQPL